MAVEEMPAVEKDSLHVVEPANRPEVVFRIVIQRRFVA
jgi:hypothetical protein